MRGKRIVRMLLRVSSNQQLEADGDLSVQRRIVADYISQHPDWILDGKEYFEGSKSGYKTSVRNRDTLQEVMEDARNKEYDILAVYKDDRIGRRMWEIGAYVMALKNYGVDIYTVKDGCISPEGDDIMGQMMLALRFGNAQKSSSDTGMRVKDTAQKLVQQGRFMGGAAPYGYELVLSGELSKHGRALHRLNIISEQAEVVRHIYNLSLNMEFGSSRIAALLNQDAHYKTMAPNDIWKSGTVTSILTNPVYAGYMAYKRRERRNGRYHRLDSGDWIRSSEPDESLRIIDCAVWDSVQERRKRRADKYCKSLERQGVRVMRRNDGALPLMDVLYCGYCGKKLTNGTRYSYWTVKGNNGCNERRARKIPIYRCKTMHPETPHNQSVQFRADQIEKVVLESVAELVQRLLQKEDIAALIAEERSQEKKALESEVKRLEKESKKAESAAAAMEVYVPEAVMGAYPLSVDELVLAIRRQRQRAEGLKQLWQEKKNVIQKMAVTQEGRRLLKSQIPTWRQVAQNASKEAQRALVGQLIERIDVTDERIVIRFKVNKE